MKEPKDKKARARSAKAMDEHFKAGGTGESWNKLYDITAESLRDIAKEILSKVTGNLPE